MGLRKMVLHPQGLFLQLWNKLFVVSCVLALSLDSLFFYIPVIDGKHKCVKSDEKLLITACVLRTFIDVFYLLHIIFQFLTALSCPVFGGVELIDDHWAIAKAYFSTYFFIDILSILPLPQLVVLDAIPVPMLNALELVVSAQNVPRLIRIFPITKEMTKAAPVYATTAWPGAAYSLAIYALASHVVGAIWYLFSIRRLERCWRVEYERFGRDVSDLYCGQRKQDFAHLMDLAFLNGSCPLMGPDEIKDSTVFNFGMFLEALQSQIVETSSLLRKVIYCFWWGFHNVGSLGQNLRTSSYPGEILFAAFISVFGLVFVSSFIGIMIQNYLQSTNVKLEERRMERQETEQWMSNRLLPDSLRQRIRRYLQYKWIETRGFEEENLIRKLPVDLRRDIKRHLCLSLLTRVPVLEIMDEQLLDALCDRLKSALFTKDSVIVREGDQMNEMLFIIQGNVAAIATNGGFFNSVNLKAGDFCGEELLAWAFDPHSSTNLPISTRTIQVLSEVQAFALMSHDLKSLASQFHHVDTKQLGHTLRCGSLQWKTWAACFIQSAWRRHCQRKLHKCLVTAEDRLLEGTLQRLRTRLLHRLSLVRVPLEKPSDPDFTTIDAKKIESSNTDHTVMEELKSLKVGMEAIAAARDCVCGNPRQYSTEVQLYEEMDKVEGISDEMRMRVYQALCEDPSAARGFLACPAQQQRALWVKVKFGASML